MATRRVPGWGMGGPGGPGAGAASCGDRETPSMGAGTAGLDRRFDAVRNGSEQKTLRPPWWRGTGGYECRDYEIRHGLAGVSGGGIRRGRSGRCRCRSRPPQRVPGLLESTPSEAPAGPTKPLNGPTKPLNGIWDSCSQMLCEDIARQLISDNDGFSPKAGLNPLEVWPESGGSRVSGYTWGQPG